jgi:hypothetical protein
VEDEHTRQVSRMRAKNMSEGDNIRTQIRRISSNPHDARTSVAGMQNALIQPQ